MAASIQFLHHWRWPSHGSETLGILDSPTNPLPVGLAFRGFPIRFRYDLSVCSPPSADRTGLPQLSETFTSRLPMSWSPAPSLGMTTAATGQFLPVGLSPTRIAASFAAPDPGEPFSSTGLFRSTRFRVGLQDKEAAVVVRARDRTVIRGHGTWK